jgi:hypothetical protein
MWRSLLACVLVVLALGCYRNAGPIVTEVHRGADGPLGFTRCDLIVSRSLFAVGDDNLEHCVDEGGRAVASPTPHPRNVQDVPVASGADAGSAAH